jgi:quercetin dioxygenase-like cupin family protein
VFICWDGSFDVQQEGREPVALHPGDVFVVRKGTRHRPVARATAHTLMIERPETRQYGS